MIAKLIFILLSSSGCKFIIFIQNLFRIYNFWCENNNAILDFFPPFKSYLPHFEMKSKIYSYVEIENFPDGDVNFDKNCHLKFFSVFW